MGHHGLRASPLFLLFLSESNVDFACAPRPVKVSLLPTPEVTLSLADPAVVKVRPPTPTALLSPRRLT